MRFGRKSGNRGTDAPEEAVDPLEADAVALASGPRDASAVDLDEHEGLDLGGLVVTPHEGSEVQLQVDEETGQVISVVLVGEEGGCELRAFAASRGAGAWDELRPRIAAELARTGGTSTEEVGTFGPELFCQTPVETPAGEPAVQVTRIIGCEGPNWLLRATLIGGPAVDDDLRSAWEDTIRRVVVRRGREAMPPGTPLPLTLPPDVRPA